MPWWTIILNGSIPLVCSYEESEGLILLKIVKGSFANRLYGDFSRWAGCLGNPIHNSLLIC